MNKQVHKIGLFSAQFGYTQSSFRHILLTWIGGSELELELELNLLEKIERASSLNPPYFSHAPDPTTAPSLVSYSWSVYIEGKGLTLGDWLIMRHTHCFAFRLFNFENNKGYRTIEWRPEINKQIHIYPTVTEKHVFTSRLFTYLVPSWSLLRLVIRCG